MKRHGTAHWLRWLPAIGLIAASSLVSATDSARAGGGFAFNLMNVGAYGGEPSIASDSKGILYETTPSGLPSGQYQGSPPVYRSSNGGSSWTLMQPPDSVSFDDCLATDQANSLYWCNLNSATASIAPLQADVWKSSVAEKCVTSCAWQHGAGTIGSTACGTSCSPFGVDRDWTAAAIPAGGNSSNAEVVLMYHDFYGPSQIWVNISQDGGKTFGPPIEVLANSSIPGAVEAQGYTMCNTVPAGTGIVKPGLPHAGRIYVSWIAADLPQNAAGCNITQAQSFHTLWLAYSDNNGVSWTAQQAFDTGVGHDTSSPFVSFALDNQGNPYLGFTSPGPGENFTTCATESSLGTVQSDPSCAFHMWVVWSANGGDTWDGGGGLIPGSAASAYEVDTANVPGTDVFPTIAAAGPGQVDVSWLHTTEIVPTDDLGKFLPGGCAGPGPANGNPTTYPPTCSWNLFAAQSLNLTATPGLDKWLSAQLTSTPMHIGDICNLGIFCVDPNSNRNLLDFDMATIDAKGCMHIAYADDNANFLKVANQTSGCIAPPKR